MSNTWAVGAVYQIKSRWKRHTTEKNISKWLQGVFGGNWHIQKAQ